MDFRRAVPLESNSRSREVPTDLELAKTLQREQCTQAPNGTVAAVMAVWVCDFGTVAAGLVEVGVCRVELAGVSSGSARLSVHLLLCFNRLLMHSWHRVTLAQGQPVIRMPEGPLILAANHTASLDPFILQSVLPRPVRWMMAAEYLELPGLSWFFRTLDVIPVERDGKDSTATRAALRALANGEVLGIFPEGKIETADQLLPLQPGIARLSIKAKAPILPAYISGTQRLQSMTGSIILPQESSVAFGSLIQPGGRDDTLAEVVSELGLLRTRTRQK